MTLRSPRLEGIFGVPIDTLAAEHIQTMVRDRVPESFDLDYKVSLYGSSDANKRDLAGDVVALANTAGGVILLGVDEDDQARAIDAPGVLLSDDEQRRMGAIIAAGVAPVPSFNIYPIRAQESEAGSGTGYYATAVQRTTAAPHAVIVNTGFRYPRRNGAAIHDDLVLYRQYQKAQHGLCNARHLRELAGMAELTGQAWPTQLAELLVELHVAVQTAKANCKTKLTARRLATFGKRYDTLIAQGKQLNPRPPRTGKRGRPALGAPGSLLARLEIHRADVLRFATDFTVPSDNNQAERDVRMVKLQQKISGGWRSNTGAEAFLDVRSYLGTARKHGQSAMVVLRELFTGQPWIPAVGASP